MKTYDVIVLGAGISGLGVARALGVEKKLKILVIEKESTPLAKTSAAMLGIIHGGIRFLKSFNLMEAWRSWQARKEIFSRYHNVVKPIYCYFPLLTAYELAIAKLVVQGSLFLEKCYNQPSRISICHSQLFGKQEDRRLVSVRQLAPTAADFLLWQDGFLHDAKELERQIIGELEQSGCHLAFDSQVHKVERRENNFVVITDKQLFAGKWVVNCAGFCSQALRPPGVILPTVKWAIAMNLVLRKKWPTDICLALRRSRRGGALFVVPRREDSQAVGTYYDDARRVTIEDFAKMENAAKFVEELAEEHPQLDCSQKDLVCTESGYIPVKSIKNGSPVFLGASKTMQIGNYIEQIASKYTTFLDDGRRVARLVR